ncbi:MAG: FtsB family cell division protein [Caulobacterales bacterium]|uniref:FtsB family cell division protein n=1 Tax=Glycocaulis sp. TaxID=1969725 RepID=UPI003F9EFA3A
MNALKRFILMGLMVGVLGYVAHHAFYSDRGFVQQATVAARIAQAEAELEAVRAERLRLEDRVARLSPSSGELDLDYVEERAREVLNFAHPHEIIVRLAPQPVAY